MLPFHEILTILKGDRSVRHMATKCNMHYSRLFTLLKANSDRWHESEWKLRERGITATAELAAKDAELTTLRAQVAGLEERYNELLFAVGNKYKGETRHQTALRYIRERESASSDAASAVKEPA